MGQRELRLLVSITGVAAVTYVAYSLVPVNATTVGFAYLLLVLIVASTWGFVEALVCSILSTLAFNFFFFEPVGTFVIAEPANWIALSSFLATSLIASRLSDQAKRRALDAIQRQQDIERLYTFSRAILLIDTAEAFPKLLVRHVADTFELNAVVLYDRRTGEFHRAGPSDFDGMDDQLREAARCGTSFSDVERERVITAVRLGSEPIASLAVQGARMPDPVMQGIANLVAIGMERARAHDLAHQVEAARQSEQLRTTLIDAMAHEFKTPLTSIKAATSSLLSNPDQPVETRTEILKVADEEAEHLRELIDNAVEMARLDAARLDVHLEMSNLGDAVREVVASMQNGIDNRPLEVDCENQLPEVAMDRRLVKLAVKQLLDNALKYSPPSAAVNLRTHRVEDAIALDVTDRGKGIPVQEQGRIFQRFFRSPSVQHQVPGSGLGLTIALRIAQAHNGDLTVTSNAGETTFRFTLPLEQTGVRP